MRQGPTRDGATSSAIRRLAPSVCRVVGSTSTLLVLYAVWPLDQGSRLPLAARLVVALIGLGLVFAFQLRSIVRSPRPGVRAVEALAASIPLLLMTFATTCFAMSVTDPDAFNEPLSKGDAMYFAITVFATVGFGDIAPRSDAARLVVSIQMLVNLLVVGVGLRVVVGAVQIGRQRSETADEL